MPNEQPAATTESPLTPGSLRAALNAGASALRRYRRGETGEEQAALLENHAEQLRTPSATLLYGAAVAYLLQAGWRRMELGSGWWWREGMEEATVGDALDQQLEADGIDFRTALTGEPEEFCG